MRAIVIAVKKGIAVLLFLLLVLPLSMFPAQKASAITYYSVDSNLLVPKSVYPAELDNFIRLNRPDSKLIGLGQAWVNAQNKYGIDAVYLMSHAIWEAGWDGNSRIAREKKNIYGYGAGDSDPYGGAYTFSSFEQCIDVVAGKIFSNYLSPSGKYYTAYGPTLRGMNVHYASGQTWANGIAGVMNQYYNTYPFQASSPPDPFLSRAFVAHLYRKIFRRDAVRIELEAWANTITNYSPRRLVAETIVMSRGSHEIFVTDQYQGLLGREPDPAGLDYWADQMDSDTTEREVKAALFGSPEYLNNLADKTNTGYITSLYWAILGRAPDQAGLSGWTNLLSSGWTRTQGAYGFLSSVEYFQRYITVLYSAILDRAPEQGGPQYWATFMSDPNYPLKEEQVKREFCSIDEFSKNGLNNFVSSFYQKILGRQADAAGLSAWVNTLWIGRTRPTVACSLFYSYERCRNYMTGLYQNILGRQPDTAGLEGWSALKTKGLPDETMKAYFYGSDEYYLCRVSPSNNQQFVTTLYQRILGRQPDAGGLAFWTNILNSGAWNRTQIAGAILNSREHHLIFVNSIYPQILDRPPDAIGLNGWTTIMDKGYTEIQVMTELYSSYEYELKHL